MFVGFLNQNRHGTVDMNVSIQNLRSNAEFFGQCTDSPVGATWRCAQPCGVPKSWFSGIAYTVRVGLWSTWILESLYMVLS